MKYWLRTDKDNPNEWYVFTEENNNYKLLINKWWWFNGKKSGDIILPCFINSKQIQKWEVIKYRLLA